MSELAQTLNTWITETAKEVLRGETAMGCDVTGWYGDKDEPRSD